MSFGTTHRLRLTIGALFVLAGWAFPAAALASPPTAPQSVSASPASTQALVSWSAPSSDGGSPISSYTITPYIGATAQTPVQVSNGSAGSVSATGLTDGTAYTFTVKATNADGTGPESAHSSAVTPDQTIFDFSGTPSIVDSGDDHAVNLGVKFTADSSGTITGIRFYKAQANTGSHVGSLYTSDGQLLATATFTGETASGWQTALFGTPVPITAGTTYVASYYAPNGHYSASQSAFSSAVDNPPLHAPANASDANGVFAYSPASTFPNNSFNASNYWVDVLFAPPSGSGGSSAPSAPQNVSASPATSQALVSWSAPASNGGSPITSYTVTPYIGTNAQTPVQVNNGSATSAKVTGLTNGTAYTFTVKATNTVGSSPESTASAAVTPRDTIFDFTGSPQNIDSGDTISVEVGLKFTADSSGQITGIRFYKAQTNTGTHIGSLWTASGQLLGQVTFAGESASGWQTATFANPVQISSGTTYVAAYLAPNGHYSATPAGLTNATDNPPLHALANSTSVNGTYAYSTTSTFPTNTFNANNYWVDVLFTPTSNNTPPGQPTNVAASPLPESASVSWTAPSTGGAVANYTVTPYTSGTAQPPVTVSGSTTTATVPGLIPDQSYTFVVQATNAAGSGPASAASNAITPTPASAPSAPQNVAAAPATSEAVVSWTAPSTDGGSPITGYKVTPSIGGTAQAPIQVNNGAATSTTVTGLTNGSAYTFSVKAVNGAGSSPASAASSPVTPDFTIFDFSGTPSIVDSGDGQATELGVKFTADVSGTITGIRFYKAQANTGAHIGNLWTPDGQQLAQVSFSGETASGWQSATFSHPVSINAGVTYVASVFDPNGHYSATPAGFGTAVDNAPLHGIANSASVNGLYAYTVTNAFPTNTFNANNYWVDVLFAPTSSNAAPGQPSNVGATPGYGGATVTWTAPWDGGSPITGYTITPYIGSNPQTPTTITGSPPQTTATISGLTNGTSYTFTVKATNANGTGAASSASTAVTPGPQPGGQWSNLMNWPLVAIHAMLLNTGKVLVWDGWHQPEPSQEFDPNTQTFSAPINSPDGIFCSAMVPLPDGRMLVVGGYGELSTGNLGIVDTNIYDPATSSWTRVADMHSPRWYESLTQLGDGRYVAVSGKSSDFGTWADTPEVYDPSTNTWTLLPGVSTSQIHELEYPNSYLLPNGNVFVLGPQEDKSFELNVDAPSWTQVGGSSGVVNGGSVMYRPGKVLYAGGAPSLGSPSTAKANAAVIDLTQQTPAWRSIASMAYPRAFNTMQMLADGTVLAVGGESNTGQQGGQGEVTGGVLPAEIWDPNTEQWTTVASMAATRGYHTSTLLMPDGRVLVAGSGHAAPGLPGQYSAQFYSPPYLFKGPRPTITSAPSSSGYNTNITINTPDAASIRSVNLVDLGTSTHQMDFNQHFVPLSFTAGSGSLSVQTPANANWAPPGQYMIFIVDSNGVPSVASFITIGSSGGSGAAAPSVPTNTAATALTAQSARITWRAAADHGSPVTSYTVTPYTGSTPLRPTTVTGSPAATSTTVSGLASGRSYTFKVKASNRHGSSAASKPTNVVVPTATPRPTFVQKAGAYADTTTRLPLTLRSKLTTGDRLIVEASIWGRGATAAAVTDSAHNRYAELWRGTARDGTELSVWSAPVVVAGGPQPTITVTPNGPADVGAVALEYSGLSKEMGTAAVDRVAGAAGLTGRGTATVGSGTTSPITASNELAIGLYADSGYGDKLVSASGYSPRLNVSPSTTTMEQLVEDRVVGSGARISATVRTGAQTPWLMATVVFKNASADRKRGAHAGAASTGAVPAASPATSAAAGQPLVPLSQRKRPHPIAGGIAVLVGRNAAGKLIRFYCLVSPSGQKIRSTATANPFRWMPPLPAFRPPGQSGTTAK